MKNISLYGVIAILVVILFFKDCSNIPVGKPDVIVTPEVIDSFPPQKPTHEPIKTVVIKDVEYRTITKEIVVKNDSLLDQYKKQNDSLKFLTFKKAIQLNKFSSKFEDDNIILNINGIVQGEVQEITPSYIIKPKKIEVKTKEVKFRLLAGFEVGNDILFTKPLLKANLGFQNAKGNILTASYDSEKRIMLGYSFPLLTIKR